MIRVIAARELRSLFVSPLAWVMLAVVQFIMGYLFLTRIELFLQFKPRLLALENPPGLTDIVVAALFGNAGVVLLLVVPLLTMRLISEERRNGTLPVLLAAPISMTEIVLGKYLGLLTFFIIMVLMISLMPLSLLLGGSLDMGQFGACLLGLCLVLASFTAIGLFLSSLTAYPTIAGVSTFGVLLLLWIIDWAGSTGADGVSGLFAYVSIMRHFQPLLKGVFNSADIIYYVLLSILFLILTVWRLDLDRLQR